MIHYFIFVLPVICNAANSNLVNENVLIKCLVTSQLADEPTRRHQLADV